MPTAIRQQTALDIFLTAARGPLPYPITCPTPNAAINLRFRMYEARKRLRSQVEKEVREHGEGYPLQQRLIELEGCVIKLEASTLLVCEFAEPQVVMPTEVVHNPAEWTPAKFLHRPTPAQQVVDDSLPLPGQKVFS